ncbi:rCG59144 [Rattus norvegicus]|uniref:RCG59144 n=1 Tax=Rattus norvegicus TaxID=10116 RepID=A6KIY2_RAT|nr:rCG59144 [Rattus norvegicus]
MRNSLLEHLFSLVNEVITQHVKGIHGRVYDIVSLDFVYHNADKMSRCFTPWFQSFITHHTLKRELTEQLLHNS